MDVYGVGYGKLLLGARGERRPGEARGLYRYMPPSFETCSVSPELALEYLEWAGIDGAVLMQAPMYGNHNEYIATVVRRFPERFVGIAVVDPRGLSEASEELMFVHGLGLRGVKLEPPDTPLWLDDPVYDPFWAEMIRLGLLLVVDLGRDPLGNPYSFQVCQLETLVKRHPELIVDIMHLGVSEFWSPTQTSPFPQLQRTLALARYANTYFDMSSLPALTSWEDYPFPRAQAILQETLQKVPVERLMWGSDFPSILKYCTYPQTLSWVRRQCQFISPADMEWLFGGTAARLFDFKHIASTLQP